MDKQTEILGWLDVLGIAYELIPHEAAYTMSDIKRFGLTEQAVIVKNLFLRNHSGKQHFLICLAGDKRADLQHFGTRLGTRLSFASPERLEKHLNLAAGAVTPLGVYYNKAHTVKVYLDWELKDAPRVGVHPGKNTATVVMRGQDLMACLEASGVEWHFMDL